MPGKESVTIGHLLQYTRFFPLIVEVDQDTRTVSDKSTTKRLEKGDLLWLLRYCQDEETNEKAVRVCKFDAPNLEFPVVVGDSLKVFRRTFADVRHNLDMKGPLMTLNDLANLVEKDVEREISKRPVFAVSNDDHGNKNERILIHSKEKSNGYLATGKSGRDLMIPKNFTGPFVDTKPSVPVELPKFRKVTDIVKSKWLGEITVDYCTKVASDPLVDQVYKGDILKLKDTSIRPGNRLSSGDFIIFKRLQSTEGKLGEIRVSTACHGMFLATEPANTLNPKNYFVLKDYKGSFPVEVSYTGINSDPYLLSLDDDTLRKESPLKILGICTFSAIYTSVQHSDSSATPFQASYMYPDYSPMKVRAASPLPVNINVVKSFSKPQETVHVLNKNEYDTLIKKFNVASIPRKPVVDRTTLYRQSQSVDPNRRSVESLEMELSKIKSRRSVGSDTTDSKKRTRALTMGSVRRPIRQEVIDEDDEELTPPKKPLPRRRSKSWASAAEFLKKKHEMKNRPVPSPPPRRPSTELSNSLPDLSNLKQRTLPPSMRNRPVPEPPQMQNQSDLSDSLPDIREDSSSNDLLKPPMRHELRRRSSLPNLNQESDDEGEYEDEYMDMTTLVRLRMDLLNGT